MRRAKQGNKRKLLFRGYWGGVELLCRERTAAFMKQMVPDWVAVLLDENMNLDCSRSG